MTLVTRMKYPCTRHANFNMVKYDVRGNIIRFTHQIQSRYYLDSMTNALVSTVYAMLRLRLWKNR